MFYGTNVLSPEDVGRRTVERMVYELISDNVGMCRYEAIEDILTPAQQRAESQDGP